MIWGSSDAEVSDWDRVSLDICEEESENIDGLYQSNVDQMPSQPSPPRQTLRTPTVSSDLEPSQAEEHIGDQSSSAMQGDSRVQQLDGFWREYHPLLTGEWRYNVQHSMSIRHARGGEVLNVVYQSARLCYRYLSIMLDFSPLL
jgi:hypothetical protein